MRSTACFAAALLVGCGDDSVARPHGIEGDPTAGAERSFATRSDEEGWFSEQLSLTLANIFEGEGGASPNPTPGASGASGAGGASGAPTSEPVVTPPPVSQFCGDGIRGSDEECDDGPGNDDDLCSSSCQITDNLAVPPNPERKARWLGMGRHPVSAGDKGFGVAFVEGEAGASTVGLSTFDASGKRTGVARFGSPANSIQFANPVTAALPDGSFAVAWTDLNADGDGLGVALQKAVAGKPAGALQHANGQTEFAQYGADLIWTGKELVIAWIDDSDPVTAPDLRYRRFSAGLAPLGSEETLSATDAYEGAVSLARFGDGWAAAWIEAELDGSVGLVTRVGNYEWEISPLVPSAAEDVPAVVELGGSHLLVVFTVGTDPLNTGTSNVGRLRGIVVDRETGPGQMFNIDPLQPDYASNAGIAQLQPSAVRVGDQIAISWRSAARSGRSEAEELWFKPLTWSGANQTLDLSQRETPLSRGALNNAGDQGTPVLAPSPLGPNGAFVIAWNDFGSNLRPGQGRNDVAVQLAPTPGYRFCDAFAQQDTPPFTVGLTPVPDGSATRPYRICRVDQLKHLASLTSSNFILMEDLDLAEMTEPLISTVFRGTFDGGGRVLANLNTTRDVPKNGLFPELEGDGGFDGIEDGIIKNLILRNFHIAGPREIGAAVGWSVNGLIENVHVVGGSVRLTNPEPTATGMHDNSYPYSIYAGGLVGRITGQQYIGNPLIRNGRVAHNCSSSAKVSNGRNIGGLVGYGSCTSCYATGDVISTAAYSRAGGLIGLNDPYVLDGWATGMVIGKGQVGGLIGWTPGRVASPYLGHVKNSAAYGAVTGTGEVGGLVGRCESCDIQDSHAHGRVSSSGSFVGGLGANIFRTKVTRSYAKGAVTGVNYVGALLGHASETNIKDSYATGDVSASGNAGGLIGFVVLNSSAERSFSAGRVTGTNKMGAFVGVDDGTGVFTASFWNKDLAPGFPAIGSHPEATGVLALSQSELQRAESFTAKGWDFMQIWTIEEGRGYPSLLRGSSTPIGPAVLAPGESLGPSIYALTFGTAEQGTESLTGTGIKNHNAFAHPPGVNLRLFDGAATQSDGKYVIAYKKNRNSWELVTHHVPVRVPKPDTRMSNGAPFDGTALWLGHSRFLPGEAPAIGLESPSASEGKRWDGSMGYADKASDVRADDAHLITVPVTQNAVTRRSVVISADVYVPSHIEATKQAVPTELIATYGVQVQPYIDREGYGLTGPGGLGLHPLSFASLLDRWALLQVRADVVTDGGALPDSSDDSGTVTYRYFINGVQIGQPRTFTLAPTLMQQRKGPVRIGPGFGLVRGMQGDAPEAFVDNVALAEIVGSETS